MALPKFSEITLPLLQFAKDGKEHSIIEAEEFLADKFKLTDEEKNRLKPSGNERLFLHKLRWARTALKWAVLIEDKKANHFKITPRGLDVLNQNPAKITEKFLSQFPEYKQHRHGDSTDLEDLIKEFDKNRNFTKNKPEQIILAEKERDEFVTRFPHDKIVDISLDDYVIGKEPQNKDTFSYWVEFGTSHFGIVKGGSAFKHGIFVNKATQEYKYGDSFSTADQAFEYVKKGINEIVQFAYKFSITNDWKELDQKIGNRRDFLNIAILSKILALYFPNKFLKIWSYSWMNKIMDKLGIPRDDLENNRNFYEKQGRIWQKKNSHPIMQAWNTTFFSYFIGDLVMSDLEDADGENDDEILYWMIRPGRNASDWENQKRNGIIGIAFYEQLGSLEQFYTKDDKIDEEKLKETISKYEERVGAVRTNARQISDFMLIREGDKILAVEGDKKILGIGEVKGRYKYQPELAHYHTYPVEWYDTNPREINRHWQGTIMEITKEEFDNLTGNESKTKYPSGYEQILEKKKQIIFYGPPGTGKTVTAWTLARSFISKNTRKSKNYEKIKQSPISQSTEVFSLSDAEYNNFVINSIKEMAKIRNYELIKESDSGNLYTLQNSNHTVKLGFIFSSSDKKSPEDVYLGVPTKMINFLNQADEQNRFLIIINNSTRNFVVLPYEIEQKYARFVNGEVTGKWDQSGKEQHAFHITITESEVKLPTRDGTLDQKFYDCDAFQRNIPLLFDDFIQSITFHPSYSYEEFVEGIRPKLGSKTIEYELWDGIFKEISNAARYDPNNNYVLIIDEINRGNIPKIFGELITLIEKDKRGKYYLKLTYSKQEFTVPPNLYIIGTMNTADKSLTQLDLALRRRFAFVELMPDYSFIDVTIDGINLKQLVEKINEKIRQHVGRERQIAQSYFMEGLQAISTLEELQSRFENDIIPLLQEYFYEDYKKLHEVLQDGFIDKDNEQVTIDWKLNQTRFKEILSSLVNSK
jgi:5-methylcytosine-specific restriction enzyme B